MIGKHAASQLMGVAGRAGALSLTEAALECSSLLPGAAQAALQTRQQLLRSAGYLASQGFASSAAAARAEEALAAAPSPSAAAAAAAAASAARSALSQPEAAAATASHAVQSDATLPPVYSRLPEGVQGPYAVGPKAVFAVVEVGGTQYKVTPDDVVITEKLAGLDINDRVELGRVLLLGSAGETVIGRPYIPGASVVAAVEVRPTVWLDSWRWTGRH